MYKIIQEIADGDRVALQVERVGTLAVSFGSIPYGGSRRKRGKYKGTVIRRVLWYLSAIV
jgi:hypothetical protein